MNQKRKKKDGVIKKEGFLWKKIDKEKTEQCCLMNLCYDEKDLNNGWLVDNKKLLALPFFLLSLSGVWDCVLGRVCTATAVDTVPR
jgi:hypothetical protein